MIWKYSLGGQKIRMGAKGYRVQFPAQGTAQVHFDLLRVCRQVYVEASLFPRTLNTLTFPDCRSLREVTATGTLRHVQKICLRTFVSSLGSEQGLEEFVPIATFEPFKTIDITLCTQDSGHEGLQIWVEKALKARLPAKDVIVRFNDNYHSMLNEWRQS